jgi:hypothetical protein
MCVNQGTAKGNGGRDVAQSLEPMGQVWPVLLGIQRGKGSGLERMANRLGFGFVLTCTPDPMGKEGRQDTEECQRRVGVQGLSRERASPSRWEI